MILCPFPSWTVLLRNACINDTTLEFAMSMISSFPDFLDFNFWFLLFAKMYDQKLELRKIWKRAKSTVVIWITMYFWATLWMHELISASALCHLTPNTFFRVNSHAVSHWRGYYVLYNSFPPTPRASLGLVSVAIIIISVCMQLVSWSQIESIYCLATCELCRNETLHIIWMDTLIS